MPLCSQPLAPGQRGRMGWSSCRLTLPRRKLHPAGRQGAQSGLCEEITGSGSKPTSQRNPSKPRRPGWRAPSAPPPARQERLVGSASWPWLAPKSRRKENLSAAQSLMRGPRNNPPERRAGNTPCNELLWSQEDWAEQSTRNAAQQKEKKGRNKTPMAHMHACA